MFHPDHSHSEDAATACASDDTPLLTVTGVRKTYRSNAFFGSRAPFVAVDDVSFHVRRGEVVALVGESGSGKSTLARLVARLDGLDAGRIDVSGHAFDARSGGDASRTYRRAVQLVFQDPFASLSPLHSVAAHLERPLSLLAGVPRELLVERVMATLRAVGLEPAEAYASRMPHELSGGQRQRVAIARAIASTPDLLIADEPTSMLDVSLRAGVLDLLDRLRRERAIGILLITHDLAGARQLADRLLVLYKGRVVEEGPTARILDAPAHPYTRALVEAVRADELGPPHDHRDAPPPGTAGCAFAPRCPHALPACTLESPRAADIASGHRVRCHLFPSSPEPESSPP